MSTTTPAPIVVGVDESDTAAAAADRAADLARAMGAPLHLVSAIDPGRPTTVEVGSDSWILSNRSSREQFLASMAVRFDDVDVEVSCRTGKPQQALTEHAEQTGAEVIVVGNRRVQGVSRVLGSVASDVAKHAPCDVYVVHTND